MKYPIKPSGMTKAQGFRQDLQGYDLVLYPWELRQHFRGMT